MKKVLLSGIQPTGDMHVGNYFGAIKQFVDMQNDYDAHVFIADLHALTTVQNSETLKKHIFNVTATYLACGLDPAKVTLFQQSAIGGELCELTWMFNCITTVAYLERAVAYKDANQKAKEPTVGLFDYPMLMSADILMQDADVVPVGSDQKQHVEFARDTAEKFNRIWASNSSNGVFKLPEPLILESTGIVPGIDGRKMSKSYDNTIPLFGTDEEITKAVMSIVTDSSGERPENVYAIHKLFRPESELENLYSENKGKYKILKDTLTEDIKSFVAPMREKYNYYQQNPEIVAKILEEGGQKIKTRTQSKMLEIKKLVGLI
ncbi:MAG: tryptophan--tRNA ligase [bacterium]